MSEFDSKVLDWFQQGAVGASSKCMAFHLTGRDCDGSYPHDAGDFGRCVGLLKTVPELRPRLAKMAEVNRYWAALVSKWDEIEALSGDYQAQSKAVSRAIRPIEENDPGLVRLSGNATIRFGAIKP
jgi:hypothetical protein